MSEARKRFIHAFKRGASAAEMDEHLIQLRIEQRIRRQANELASGLIATSNLALLSDLMKAALQLRE